MAVRSDTGFVGPFPSSNQVRVPVWFPDSRRVLFSATNAPTGRGLYLKDSKGVGPLVLVFSIAADASFPSAFSRDERFLVYTVVDPKTRADIWYVPWDAKPDLAKAVTFAATDAAESQGQLSPNGKWIAYHIQPDQRE